MINTVRFDLIMRTVAQTNVARVQLLIEEIRELGYQGKHMESLAHWREDVLGSEVIERGSEVKDGALKTKTSKLYPKESWLCEIEMLKLRIDQWVKKICLPYLGSSAWPTHTLQKPRPLDQEKALLAYAHPAATNIINEVSYVLCTRGHVIATPPGTVALHCSPPSPGRTPLSYKTHFAPPVCICNGIRACSN